jgi:hypothetical protein
MTDDDRYQRINLRIPRDLHARIMTSAAEASRSMNAEIIGILMEHFEREDSKGAVKSDLGVFLSASSQIMELNSKILEALLGDVPRDANGELPSKYDGIEGLIEAQKNIVAKRKRLQPEKE